MKLTLELLTFACTLLPGCTSKPSSREESREQRPFQKRFAVDTRFIRSLESRFAGDGEPLKWSIKVSQKEKILAQAQDTHIDQTLQALNDLRIGEGDEFIVTLSAEASGEAVFSNSEEFAKKNTSGAEVWKQHCGSASNLQKYSLNSDVKVCVLDRGLAEGVIITAIRFDPINREDKS